MTRRQQISWEEWKWALEAPVLHVFYGVFVQMALDCGKVNFLLPVKVAP